MVDMLHASLLHFTCLKLASCTLHIAIALRLGQSCRLVRLTQASWVVLKNTSWGVGGGCPGAGRLGGRELGDRLGALRHGVLGQLAWQDEAHRRLDLP